MCSRCPARSRARRAGPGADPFGGDQHEGGGPGARAAASRRPRPGVTLRYNFGSSGELQKQIEAGAPSTSSSRPPQRQMDELEKQGAHRARHPPGVRAERAHRDQARRLAGGHRASQPICADARVARIVIGNPKTRARGPVRRGEPPGARTLGARPAQARSSPRTCARRSTTWRGARWTRASSTPPTPPCAASAVKEAFRPAEDTYRPIDLSGRGRGGLAAARARAGVRRAAAGREGQAVLGRFGFQPPPAGVR